jgi:hypothetical protein
MGNRVFRLRLPESRVSLVHAGIEGDEKADQAAKQAAAKPPRAGQGELSLAFTHRVHTEELKASKKSWLARKWSQAPQRAKQAYRVFKNWQLDALSPRRLVSHYYQLKTGHAAIGTYLHASRSRRKQPARAVKPRGKPFLIYYLNVSGDDISGWNSIKP